MAERAKRACVKHRADNGSWLEEGNRRLPQTEHAVGLIGMG